MELGRGVPAGVRLHPSGALLAALGAPLEGFPALLRASLRLIRP